MVSQPIDLSIIIVNWNVTDLLEKCLTSVYQHTRDLKFEVVVVDNNSRDRDIWQLAKKFPKTYFIRNKRNLGFAKAVNQGIMRSRGENYLLLNPDSLLPQNTLVKLVKKVSAIKDVGIAGCKILNFNGDLQPSCRRFPSFWSQALILLKLHHRWKNNPATKKYLMKDFDYQNDSVVDQVMGACFLIKKTVVEKIGSFDDKYFLWFEEVDFCKSAKNAGLNTMFVSDLSLLHQKGESFAKLSALRKQTIFCASLIHYFAKHKPIIQTIGLILISPISLFLAAIVNLFEFIRPIKRNKNL